MVLAKETSLWALMRGRYVGLKESRAEQSVAFGGRLYKRDEEGRWRDEDGRQPDLDTCFALADQERGTERVVGAAACSFPTLRASMRSAQHHQQHEP